MKNWSDVLKQFVHEQGGEVVQVDPAHWLTPSGATVRTDGRMEDPPSNPVARLRRQRRFHAVKADDAEADMRKLDALVHGQLGAPLRWDEGRYGEKPADPADGLALVRRVAADARAAVAEIDAQLPRPWGGL